MAKCGVKKHHAVFSQAVLSLLFASMRRSAADGQSVALSQELRKNDTLAHRRGALVTGPQTGLNEDLCHMFE